MPPCTHAMGQWDAWATDFLNDDKGWLLRLNMVLMLAQALILFQLQSLTAGIVLEAKYEAEVLLTIDSSKHEEAPKTQGWCVCFFFLTPIQQPFLFSDIP